MRYTVCKNLNPALLNKFAFAIVINISTKIKLIELKINALNFQNKKTRIVYKQAF